MKNIIKYAIVFILLLLFSGCQNILNVIDDKTITPTKPLHSNNTSINTILKNESNHITSNPESLGMLSFVLPDRFSIDKSEKVLYSFLDEKGEKSGFISSIDYMDNFDFLTQMPNHSSVTNDEYIDIPLGKCRLITLDADNGTAESGITGTHTVYYASVPIKGTAMYMLNFTMNDKKPETKNYFIEILNKLSIK